VKVVLYKTPNCNKCLILKGKLEGKHIEFIEKVDLDFMITNGFLSAPVLSVDNKLMSFKEGLEWVKSK